jgi:transposase InsO family protein
MIQKMKNQQLDELALFRYSLIAPLVNDTYSEASKEAYYRKIASKEYKLPNGKLARFSPGTIKDWFKKYSKGNYDALIPKTRSDAGNPRVLDVNTINRIHELKEQYPYITGSLIYQKLIEEGYCKTKISLSSVLRYIRDNDLKRPRVNYEEMKAFEMEYANTMWQADTSYFPSIRINGKKLRIYLIAIIDDASRHIVHAEFFLNDNAINVQIALKKAVSKYGVPRMFFLDNGSSYKNGQLEIICASLGITKIHTKVRKPESKAKIERFFRTVKDNWIYSIDWSKFNSLDFVNTEFNLYLSEKYTHKLHSSLNMTPKERYMKDYERFKFIPKDKIDEYFLHRVSRKVKKDATVNVKTKLFEVPQKYIGQSINIRFTPTDFSQIYIYGNDNQLKDTAYPLNKIENSKIKRKSIDYSDITGGNDNV